MFYHDLMVTPAEFQRIEDEQQTALLVRDGEKYNFGDSIIIWAQGEYSSKLQPVLRGTITNAGIYVSQYRLICFRVSSRERLTIHAPRRPGKRTRLNSYGK